MAKKKDNKQKVKLEKQKQVKQPEIKNKPLKQKPVKEPTIKSDLPQKPEIKPEIKPNLPVKPEIKPEIKPTLPTKPIINKKTKKELNQPLKQAKQLPAKQSKKQISKKNKLLKNKISTKNKIPKNNILNKKQILEKQTKQKSGEEVKVEEGIKKTISGTGVLETYNIELDKAIVKVEIEKRGSTVNYNLYVPEIGLATAALLNEVRNELVTATTISMKEITDPSVFNVIKRKFMNETEALLKENIPTIDPKIKDFLIGKLMQDMLGLGEIEFLVNDPNLEEIVIPSSKEPIRVYHKKYGWVLTNLKIAKEEEIVNYSNIIARRIGRQITVLTPLLDAHLVTGDRVNAILYPINTKGNTITIRKFARDPYTIIDLINNNTCNIDLATILWIGIEYEMNILISGGTASGKTVLLNACMPFIPPNHRIISVEDTRELMLPDFLYWTPLVTRVPNPEGKGEVSMLDLLINSLRMRPDRIVLGEMRRKREALVLFEAMHTGHSVYATVHADSAAETISRLTNPPISVPPNLLKAVNLNVVMFRDRRKGIRRVLQIAEFEASKDRADANILYRWIPEKDKIIKHSENPRFFETLNKNTGMSQTEIIQNLEEKKSILLWMIKNKLRDLNDFGRIMNLYYTDKENLMNCIRKNDVKRALGR